MAGLVVGCCFMVGVVAGAAVDTATYFVCKELVPEVEYLPLILMAAYRSIQVLGMGCICRIPRSVNTTEHGEPTIQQFYFASTFGGLLGLFVTPTFLIYICFMLA